jgi:subtilisin-like proprotein convertase family protein
MIKKRSAQLAVLACAGCASLWLLAMPAPAGAKTKTAQFTQCVSAAVNIPDGPPPGSAATNPAALFTIPVTVPKFKGKQQNGVVTRFNSVGVRISHTDDGDLALFLVSPGGRAAALSTFRDQSTNVNPDPPPDRLPSGDGYGTGAANCSGSRVDFGDGFPTSIATPGNTGVDAPITGSFSPEQPLSAFVGGPARGFWTLIVQDTQFQDVGQIDALSLSFDYSYKAKKKKKKRR